MSVQYLAMLLVVCNFMVKQSSTGESPLDAISNEYIMSLQQ